VERWWYWDRRREDSAEVVRAASSTIAADSSMHSLQMYTPGPATSLSTVVLGLPQNEQYAMTSSVGVAVDDMRFSCCWRILRRAVA
jgi:hypothetical protein